jgi:hypothetical protein
MQKEDHLDISVASSLDLRCTKYQIYALQIIYILSHLNQICIEDGTKENSCGSLTSKFHNPQCMKSSSPGDCIGMAILRCPACATRKGTRLLILLAAWEI